MVFIKEKGLGLILCLAIAVPSWFLGKAVPVVGGPVFGILIGMLVTLLIPHKRLVQPGINFVSKKILQLAVVLLGFGLNLQMVAEVGWMSLPIILSTITTALVVSYLLWRLLKHDAQVALLVGVGSSICGGSAIAATAPVIQSDDKTIAQSISVIFLFNVIAALIFPTLGAYLGLTNEGFGLFAGTAVNDTSSVTAAASMWDTLHGTGTAVLDTATIVKLTRTLAIIPITLVLSVYQARKAKKLAGNAEAEEGFSLKKSFPFFIIWFVLASLITTLVEAGAAQGVMPGFLAVCHTLFGYCKLMSKFFIVMAMSAIGLNTHLVHLIKSGAKPIVQGLICWIAIAGVSLLMQHVLGLW